MRFLLPIILMANFCGCLPKSPNRVPDHAAETLILEYSWTKENLCVHGFSPEIRLAGVPQGTRTLRYSVTDLNVPSFYHGSGDLPYSGTPVLPAGAFRDYHGPCPPMGRVHHYRIRIQALDVNGRILAQGELTKTVNRAALLRK